MELLVMALEVILWVVDLLAMAGDVYSWYKGKPNRNERREARAAGDPIPPRDKWNRRVITLTILVIVVTGVLLLKQA